MADLHMPAGWPEAVPPPGTPDWEAGATEWLLGLIPDLRTGPAMARRHPVILAAIARHVLAGGRSTARGPATAPPGPSWVKWCRRTRSTPR